MKTRNKILLVLLLVAFTLGSVSSARGTDGTGTPLNNALTVDTAHDSIAVLMDTTTEFVFTLEVPWQALALDEVSVDGVTYTTVSFPGWVQTAAEGAPVLPFRVVQLGVPAGAVVSLQVTPGKARTYILSTPILPGLSREVNNEVNNTVPGSAAAELGEPEWVEVVEPDPLVYGQNAFYPGQAGGLGADGWLRQQRVVGLNLFPVQVNPSVNTLVVYESVDVKVSFSDTASTYPASPQPESDAFEQLFRQALLNYDTARQWRTDPGATFAPLTEGIANDTLPWTPPDPAWRVKTAQEGFHKLTYAELETAGVPVGNVDPGTFQVFNQGVEVAIQVSGEGDGSFDPGDYVLFYAAAVNTKYTAENVYWFTYGGTDQGKRAQPVEGAPGAADVPANFTRVERSEENLAYVSQVPGDDRLDRWMGKGLVASPTVPGVAAYALDLPSPAAIGGSLKIALAGYSSSIISPDHHLVFKINNQSVGEYWFDGFAYTTFEMAVPAGLLSAGVNTLEVRVPGDSGAASDVVFVDWVELTYESGFVTDRGSLCFEYGAGTHQFRVGNFTSDAISVYEVKDGEGVGYLADVEINELGGLYRADFQVTIADEAKYCVVENSALFSPAFIEKDTSSSLGALTNGADHIIITPAIFKDQADILSAYRASQGLRSVVVKLQDIYDQFGYGLQDVDYVKDFLAFAYHNWEGPAPAYVVLLGDGNQDPKGYLSTSLPNYTPAYLAAADPWVIETAADNRYVTFIGEDTLPDMMLGRLAAGDPAEANILVNKIIAYESTPPAIWQQKVLLVADDADYAGNFSESSENLADCCLPDLYTPEKVYFKVTHPDVASTRAAIINGLNQGVLLTNFIGHATRTQWADEAFFKQADISSLANGEKLTVVLSMTCLDGQYQRHQPGTVNRSMAEMLTVTAGRGAVASWSPTGMGVSSGHDYLNRGFFEAVFENGAIRIGEGTAAGKLSLWSTGVHLDMVDTYLLFGDPATRLPVVYVPQVSDIPDQVVFEGQAFAPIELDDYVVDYNDADADLTWSYTGNSELLVEIVDRVMMVSVPESGWLGTEVITLRVVDPQGYEDEVSVSFTVLPWAAKIWLPFVNR